jgi:hypothetical protein
MMPPSDDLLKTHGLNFSDSPYLYNSDIPPTSMVVTTGFTYANRGRIHEIASSLQPTNVTRAVDVHAIYVLVVKRNAFN